LKVKLAVAKFEAPVVHTDPNDGLEEVTTTLGEYDKVVKVATAP